MAKPYLIFKVHTGIYYAQIRLADGTPLLSALTEKNIDVLEEIFKWDELMPSIQNFKEWTRSDAVMPRTLIVIASWIR